MFVKLDGETASGEGETFLRRYLFKQYSPVYLRPRREISFCYQEPPGGLKLPEEFPRSRADNGRKIFRETCTANRAPSSRMLFVISPPPASRLHPPFHPRMGSGENNDQRRERESRKKRRREREDRLLCDTRLPRIPERRLSPLPLNIHPLGKPDKNKEKAPAVYSISRPPSTVSKCSSEAWHAHSVPPATRGSLFIPDFILY